MVAFRKKTLNSPPYTALFRDLCSRNPMTETLHFQLHGSDFASAFEDFDG